MRGHGVAVARDRKKIGGEYGTGLIDVS